MNLIILDRIPSKDKFKAKFENKCNRERLTITKVVTYLSTRNIPKKPLIFELLEPDPLLHECVVGCVPVENWIL